MPSKNKTAAKRRKCQRSRSRRRARTIRGGGWFSWPSSWPWTRRNKVAAAPFSSPLDSNLNSNPPIQASTPPIQSFNPPNPRSSQPRLPITPTNPAILAILEEGSRKIKEINELKKIIEPQTEIMKALTDEYKILGERKDKTEDQKESHQMFLRRQEIRNEIAVIKKNSKYSSVLGNIERLEKEYTAFIRRNKSFLSTELPTDTTDTDAETELKRLIDAVYDREIQLNKAASGIDAALHAQGRIAERNQDELSNAMNITPYSTSQFNEAVNEVTRGVSESRSGSSARGSLARGSSRSGSPARGSSARSSSP